MRKLFCSSALLLIFLTALFAEREGIWVERFSLLEAGSVLTEWKSWEFSRISQQTEYSLAGVNGRTVLRAQSDEGASAVIKSIEVDLEQYPVLEWTWKTDGPFEGGDWLHRETDDFPLRMFVIVELDAGPLSFFKRLAGEFAGKEAINYVWAKETEMGELSASPASDRVRMIALTKGSREFGSWVNERRNVATDYATLFEKNPGRVVAVALMADTDDTGSACTSYFGDIRFSAQ